MDQRPIGVFDSGSGGLTAVREIRSILPSENIIYFGDTSRVPYGGRSAEILLRYARQDVHFLRSFDVKALLVACGTVSTNALPVLAAENDIPVLGVVKPSCAAAAAATRNKRVGLIATAASVRSGAYERCLAALDGAIQVYVKACPLFVPLVENGRFRRGDKVAELVVAEYLAPIKSAGVDTLVLGCTHYPLLTEVIGAYMGPDVTLINSGAACARHVAALLSETEARSDSNEPGRRRYFVSDRVEGFSGLASIFLGQDVRGDVEQVDITLY